MEKTIKDKLHIPSFRATLHFLVVQIVTQLAWGFFSKQFENKMIREAGFLLLFVVVLIVVAWYLPKLSPVWSGANKTSKKEEQAGSLLQQQMLEDDERNLSQRIYSREYIWSFDSLKKTDSFMEMVVTLINAAVFPILIQGVDGSFLIEGDPCAHNAEMEGENRIPRGESANIRIKQHLSQEMVNLILRSQMRKQAVKVNLKSCKLKVLPGIIGKQSRQTKIGLNFDQDVPIPELKW